MADVTLCPAPLPAKYAVKLPWGCDLDNNLVHVSAAKNGRDCKLSCPHCSGALDAKQGRLLQWHLAHVSTTWCKGGVESLAHRRAIEILAAEKSVFLPPPDELSEGFFGNFSWAIAEVPLALENPRRVDLMLYAGSERLAVEICVSHPVDAAKEEDLRTWPFPSIEIFVDPIVALAKSEDDFIQHVLETAPRRWIHQAGWFAGTDEGEEALIAREKAKEAERFKREAYARIGPLPFRVFFLKGLAAIRNENSEFYAVLAMQLRSGKGGPTHHHSFILKCGEVGDILGLTAHKVGALVRKLELTYSPPWGIVFFNEFRCISKLSPQALIALWMYAWDNRLTNTNCEKLIARMQRLTEGCNNL